jgi:DNA-binding NarL/FixJ family response regulator
MTSDPYVTTDHCTVLICDDRQELRDAISTALASVVRFRVVGEASDRTSCLRGIRETQPDVLILDIGMPGGGPPVAAQAKAASPTTYVLVFSGIADPNVRLAMLAAGADDYVVKTGRLRPLLDALNRAFEVHARRRARPW